MDFVSNKRAQFQEMLAFLNINSVEDLLNDVPKNLRMSSPENDDGFSEYEVMRHLETISSKNTYSRMENYLGAGAYEHHVPALVGAICSKSEFLTSYTPYQAEASQGTLQVAFEFQSAICALTGLDVSNASLYDGASACAEALLMAMRIHKERKRILIANSLHPHYRAVCEQYLSSHNMEILQIPFLQNGKIDIESFKNLLDDTAAVLVQCPNFFGAIDDIKSVSQLAKEKEVLTIVCSNPMAYGLFQTAKELGADIAVGDCQPFGLPLQFGGPYAGYMACKEAYVRQMPGRIVGETVDTKGNKGFVLTLQARDQFIRQEKATSNICTNQALASLATLISILWYGKEGVKKLALTNFQRASYLKDKLENLLGPSSFTSTPIFNEFVVKFPEPISQLQKRFRQKGIEPGLDLERYYPHLKNHLLIAVTETKSKEQLDRYVQIAVGDR